MDLHRQLFHHSKDIEMADVYSSTGLEEFSQTRPTDGLFDDEIVPISGTQQDADESPAEDLGARSDTTADRETHRHAEERTKQEESSAERETDGTAALAAKETETDNAEQRPETRDSATPPRDAATDESRKGRREAKSAAQRVRAILGDRSGSGSIRKVSCGKIFRIQRM